MTAVPRAARFWHHMDALVARGESLVRAFHRVLGASSLRITPLTSSVIAAMRRGMDAVMPQGERLLRAFRRLLGSANPRKTIMLAAAGIAALGLIFVLLEISVRNEVAREATDAASANRNQMQSGDGLLAAPASGANVAFVGSLGALGAKPFSDAQTLGQASRTPIPLPRPRPKPR
jgi:hypothetical protein